MSGRAPLVADIRALLAGHGEATYRELLRVPALSLGLFAVAAGHLDIQTPHTTRTRSTSLSADVPSSTSKAITPSWRPARSRTCHRTSRTASSTSPTTSA
jgi:hypothetical protein